MDMSEDNVIVALEVVETDVTVAVVHPLELDHKVPALPACSKGEGTSVFRNSGIANGRSVLGRLDETVSIEIDDIIVTGELRSIIVLLGNAGVSQGG